MLASSLTSWLGRLRKRWQAERRSGPRLFEAPGLDAKRFKTLPAGQHPTLGEWLGPASAYVPVLRAAKLTKQADALEKAVEQFLAA